MGIARHGSGPGPTVRALASQVHPVFMIPALLSSIFGGFLTGQIASLPATLHLVAVFTGLYIAHVKDGYVDFYLRSEDESHPLTKSGCTTSIVVSSLVFASATVAIAFVVDIFAALITVPGWIIGYYHAPQLDMNSVTVTVAYPLGIALAFLGGYYVQASAITAVALAYGLLFFLILTGMKIIDDASDYEYDRSIDKPTLAVVLGLATAHHLAYGVMIAALALAVVFIVLGLIPPSVIAAVVAFLAVISVTIGKGPKRTTEILIRGSYVFILLSALAEWYSTVT